jgi:hypothetical protein
MVNGECIFDARRFPGKATASGSLEARLNQGRNSRKSQSMRQECVDSDLIGGV